jgi:hypothetical protein
LILLLDLIIVRPYYEVSEKLRAIFFAFIYTLVPFIRFLDNQLSDGQSNASSSILILFLLAIALLWTFYTLARHFYMLITDQSSDRVEVVEKVFAKTDAYDRRAALEEEEVMIKKLMKRYERVELQYNVNNARTQLLEECGSPNGLCESAADDEIEGKDLASTGLKMQENTSPSKIARKTSNYAAIEEAIKKAEEEKNFKGLKDDLLKIHKKKRKEEVKKKVTG